MLNKERQSLRSAIIRRWLALLMLVFIGSGVMAQAPPPKSDGYYVITTADQLLWLAKAVNNDPYSTYNTRLDADIDLEGVDWTPIGIGKSTYYSTTPTFQWVFDGNGHTVSNLKLADEEYSGFFGYMKGPAVVKNLTIDGVTSGVKYKGRYVGVICGTATASTGTLTISNCHVKNATVTSTSGAQCLGGLVGLANGRLVGGNGISITNSSFQGSVSNANTCGGLVGELNSYAIYLSGCTLLSGSKVDKATNCGGVCGRTSMVPEVFLTDCAIEGGSTIGNGDGSRIYGIYKPLEKPHLLDGVYQIANLSDLKWFRDYANDRDHGANARLVADIDMLNELFSPIGDYGHSDSKIYRGTFDGNGHVLSNFQLKRWSEYSGLVGYADGATIKNVTVKHVITPWSPNYPYIGTILGFGTNHTNVVNCHVYDADVFYNVDCEGDCHGGIAGKIDVGSHIEGCSFQGKVGGGDKVGGIVGEVNSGAKVYNCVLEAGSEVYGDDYIGGIGGRVYDKETKIDNCFAQQGVNIHSNSSSKYVGNIAGYTEYAPTSDSYDVRGLYYSLTGDLSLSDNNRSICYNTVVTGTVPGYTDNDYVVCTDMGVTYSYFNKRICSKAFDNVDNLKTFSFIDYNHNTGAQRAYKWIDMSIADQAFVKCYNFKSMYMKYKMGGKDGFMVMLDPTDVYPEGDNAFDGCDDLKIYVDAEKYDAFVNDSRWGKYKDRIESTTSMRKAEHTVDYVQYARDNRKNSEGDYLTEFGDGDKTLYLVHVIGDNGHLDLDNGIARIYNDIGKSYAYRTTKIWAESFKANNDLRGVQFWGAYSGKAYAKMRLTIGKRAFANCPKLRNIDVVYANKKANKYEPIDPGDVYPEDDTMIEGSENAVIRVWPDLVDKFKANEHWSAYADRIVAWKPSGAQRLAYGVYYEDYLEDETSLETDPASLWRDDADKMKDILNRTKDDFASLDVDGLVDDSDDTEYYTHVVGASNDYLDDNDGNARIYSIVVQNGKNLHAESIDSEAFLNNTSLKSIDFGDNSGSISSANVPLGIVIQKNAFRGCTNLEAINLVYYVYLGVNRVKYLEPSQVVPAKDIFGDGNTWTKIYVNPEKVDEFKADPNWKQYADRIEPYRATTGNTHTESGLVYTESGMVYDAPDGVRNFETYVTGVDDTSKEDFTIYTDIGETYAYRNVFVKGGAFKDNSSLKSVTFSDASGSSSDAHFWINMYIDDKAFDNCPNFKAMYMKYEVTSGKNHTIMLNPEDVRPRGDNAFVDCPNLKIYVDVDKYNAFIADPIWSKYKGLIVPTKSMRSHDFTEEGAKYGYEYNRDAKGTYNIEKSSDDVNVYHAHVNGPDDNLMSSYYGVATIYNDPGTTYAYRTDKILAEAYQGCDDLRQVRFKGANSGKSHTPFALAIGYRAFADCPNLQYIDVVYGNTNTKKYEAIAPTQVYPVDSTMLQGNGHALIRVWPDLVDAFKADPNWAPYADRIVAWSANGKRYTGEDGLVYTSYTNGSNDISVTELCSTTGGHDDKLKSYLEEHKSEFADASSIDFDGFLCGSSYGNVYYTRATGTELSYLRENRGRVTLYNDIGSYYNYRTVAIERNAFRGNTLLRRLDFGDISRSGKTDVPLKLLIEEGAFVGCANLEKIDLIYRKYTGKNTIVYLDPSQVIPAKNLFDADSKVQIRVGADKVEAFKADPNWKQYADRIVAYETSFDTYETEGITYIVATDDSGNRKTITGDEGTSMYETKVSDCKDTSTPTDYTIYTDIGTVRNYYCTTIQNGAFTKEKSLRSLQFADNSEVIEAQAYKWIGMKIEDGAFVDCPNFKALYMKYTMYVNADHVVMLGPDDVYPEGKDAFKGCDSLKIYVDAEYYDDFINDARWGQYKDRIVSTTSMRTQEFMRNVQFARDHRKDGTGSYMTEVGNESELVYHTHVISGDAGQLAKNKGVATIYNDPGSTYSYRTTKIWAEAFRGYSNLRQVCFGSSFASKVYTDVDIAIGSRAFADCPNLQYIDVVYANWSAEKYESLPPAKVHPVDGTMLEGSNSNVLIRVWPDQVEAFKADEHWKPYADRIVAWTKDGSAYGSSDGLVYAGYVDTEGSESYNLIEHDLNNKTSESDAKLKARLMELKDEFAYSGGIDYDAFCASNSYGYIIYSHVIGLNNDQLKSNRGRATLYNDISPYSCVSVDKLAFRGNLNLRRLDFGDVPSGTKYKNTVPLKLMIEEGAFQGCDNFESLDLVYRKSSGSIEYLDPSQVIPAKNLFDASSSALVRVGKDKVKAFKADRNWEQYASRIVAYEVTPDTYEERGLVYTVMADDDNNRRVVIGDDDKEMYETKVTDCANSSTPVDYTVRVNIGDMRTYYTTAIQAGAFNGDTSLRSLRFDESKNNGSTHGCKWIGVRIEDNAFVNCKSFEALCMRYDLTSSDLRYVMLDPSDVYPEGKDAFKGCDKLRIYVDEDKYEQFVNDSHWAPYANLITGTTSMRQADVELDGMVGGAKYMTVKNKDARGSNIMENLDGYTGVVSQVTVAYPDKSAISQNNGVLYIYNWDGEANSRAHRTTRVLAAAFEDCDELTGVRWTGRGNDNDPVTSFINVTVGRRAFANCANLRNVDMVYKAPGATAYSPIEPTQVVPDDDTMLDGSPLALIRVWPTLVSKYKADPNWAPYADRIVAWDSDEREQTETQTITMDKAGTLADKLGLTLSDMKMIVKSGDYSKYKKLKIVGPLNPTDLNTLAILAGQTRKDAGAATLETTQWNDAKLMNLDTDEFFHTASEIVLGTTPENSNLWYLDLSDATFVNLDGTARADFVLPRRTFKDCDVLETIILPRTMKKLTVEALANADNLQHVVLGNQTTAIEEGALANCPRLETLTTMRADLNISGGNQLTESSATSPFASGDKLPVLYCTDDSQAALTANDNVQRYCDDVVAAFNDKALMELMAHVSVLSENELYKLNSLGQMFLGNSEIADLTALSQCRHVTTLSDNAFAGMTGLRRVALPSNLVSMGKKLFDGCDNLLYVDWLNGNADVLTNTSRTDEDSPLYGLPRRTLFYGPVDVDNSDAENIVSTVADVSLHAPRFWRDDDETVEIPYAFTTSHAEISRVFNTGVKSTVYLPFAIDEANATALGRFYEFDSYDSSTGSVSFRRVTQTEAGKAYLFLPAAASVAATASAGTTIDVCATAGETTADASSDGMYGTWERKDWADATGSDYGYAANSGDGVTAGQFVRIAAGAWMRPMRAWLHLSQNATAAPMRLAVLFDGDEATGVVDIEGDELPAMVDVYTIDGKMVRHGVNATECLKGLSKGIYVVNGKKVYCE